MQELRANTEVIVTVGPFVDVGDGFTPQTDIALSGNEAELIKHGLTAVVDISGATWAAVADCRGYYSLTLTTAHTDTEGMLVVIVQDDSDCLPVKQEYMVLSEAAWDSKYVAKDDGFMDVNIKTVGRADAQETEANNLESACSNYTAQRGLTGTAVPDVAADGAFGLPISDAGGLDLDTQLANTHEITAARMGTLTDWIDAGRLDAILDTIAADTTTDIPALIATAQADLDTITGTGGVLIGTDAMDRSGTLDVNTKTITNGIIVAATLGADCITAAKIADDAIAAEHLATGALTADAFAADALVAATFATGAFTADAFAANALVAGTFAASSLNDKGNWNTTVPDAAGVAPTAVEIRTEIDSNSTQLSTIATDTTTDIPALIATAQADLDTITGTGGVLIGTDAMDRSATLDVNTKTITNGIVVAATLGADCITAAKIADDAIAAEHLATGALTADAFAANALVAATFAADYLTAIEGEVDDALDSAISELGVAAPTATPSVRTGLMLLYMALRNKLDVNTTASPDELRVHNNAGTIIAQKELTDDGTDYSEAKMGSG